MVTTRVTAALAVGVALGCESTRVSEVALTLSAATPPTSGDAYELFATVGGSAVSVARFEVRVVDQAPGLDTSAAKKVAVDPVDLGHIYGTIDDVSVGQPIGGIRFLVPMDLGGATDVFITREPAGDTDPVPNGAAIGTCDLVPTARGVVGCALRLPGDKTFVVGTAAIVPPEPR